MKTDNGVTATDNGLFYEGRPLDFVMDFYTPGTFASYYSATQWCYENGYSAGSMCKGLPIALKKGDYNIAKWHNLTDSERNDVDGLLLSDDFREGSCKIIIF